MLAAGHYLISIVNNTTGTDSDWYWADSSQSGNAFARDADSLPWTPYNGNVGLSFSLSGTASVPEPASLLLLGLATPIILAARRRRAAVA